MERERPLREIYYNRTGNLSTTTQLNQEVADEFMERGDMRRDISIVDSNKQPERDAVGVGSDTLAFRAIEPIRKLTEVRFKPKPFHTLIRQDDRFEIQVHERLIDDKVCKGHFIDRADYEEQFLKLLNKAVKSGSTQALFQEKLGLYDQGVNYALQLAGYILSFSVISLYRLFAPPFNPIVDYPVIFSLGNLLVHKGYLSEIKSGELPNPQEDPSIHSLMIRSSGNRLETVVKLLVLPVIPIDRWIAGRLYLARHGEKLIIPKA